MKYKIFIIIILLVGAWVRSGYSAETTGIVETCPYDVAVSHPKKSNCQGLSMSQCLKKLEADQTGDGGQRPSTTVMVMVK